MSKVNYRVKEIILMIALGFCLLFINGCGNKGDLYLPDTGSVDKSNSNNSKINKEKKKS